VAPTAQSGVNFLAGFADGNASKLRDQWIAAASGHVDKFLGHVAAIAGLVLGFKKAWKVPEEGTSKWKTKAGKVSWAISVISELKSIYSDYVKAKDPEEPGGVTINAESTISLDAKGSVAINGVKGVALSGFKGVNLSGISVGAKGHKEATIWGGLGAGVKALAGDVTMESDLKSAEVKAKKDVTVAAETGKATVQGDQDSQISSSAANVYVKGETGAFFNAGNEYGVVAKKNFVEIGKIKGGKELSSFRVDSDSSSASFTDQGIDLNMTTDSFIAINKNDIIIKTKEIDMSSSGKVKIKGSTVDIC
jgi:hypothetical protein